MTESMDGTAPQVLREVRGRLKVGNEVLVEAR
jgi:hypothetical protein